MANRLPPSPQNKLEPIIAAADLACPGNELAAAVAAQLYTEPGAAAIKFAGSNMRYL